MVQNKFLKRIVAPDVAIEKAKGSDIAAELHNYTHGINSDPLTLLAIVFSALIHDVDHQGVSNMQLGKEAPDMAQKYHNQSIAEQNSLDMSWELLMSDHFRTHRNCLFATDAEFKRFRQVLVNVVLATDIFDKELNGLRKARWEKAFSPDSASQEEFNDLRATIVIEHIIQASDVAHTMQVNSVKDASSCLACYIFLSLASLSNTLFLSNCHPALAHLQKMEQAAIPGDVHCLYQRPHGKGSK